MKDFFRELCFTVSLLARLFVFLIYFPLCHISPSFVHSTPNFLDHIICPFLLTSQTKLSNSFRWSFLDQIDDVNYGSIQELYSFIRKKNTFICLWFNYTEQFTTFF
jgi:hypothetical protein